MATRRTGATAVRTTKGGEEMTRLAWSVDETAELLGISRRSLYELLRSGELRSVKIGSRRLIRNADLERFVDELDSVA